MAFTWADVLAPPTGDDGQFDDGDYTDLDEWPPNHSDIASKNTGGSASETVQLRGFDLSNAGGEREGFALHYSCYSDPSSSGFQFDEIRIYDGNGGSKILLETVSTPSMADVVENSSSDARLITVRLVDSNYSSADIDDLWVEIDYTNLSGSNNRLRFTSMRMSKSPFTTAEKAALPTDLVGQDFACYRASDLKVLGAVDAEVIVVWPDASGNGRHLFRMTGADATYEDATEDYVSFPGSNATRFAGVFTETGDRETGNIIFAVKIYPTKMAPSTDTPAIFSATTDWYEALSAGTPGDKHILGIDDPSGDQWVLMSGDGGADHKFGGSPLVNTDFWIFEWIVDSGNEHLWENDDASPVIDAASGSNDLYGYSVGGREDDGATRYYEGRIYEFWVVEGTGVIEGDIDGARDEWVAGAPPPVTGTVAETQADQTSAISGTFTPLPVTGTVAETQADQTSVASGTYTPPLVTGTVAQTQADQTSVASGTVVNPPVTGTVAETQADQTSVASGTAIAPSITGSLAETQEDQASTASGTSVPQFVTGILARTQENQTSVASGTFTILVTGTVAETQENQTLVAVGIHVPPAPPPIPSGSDIPASLRRQKGAASRSAKRGWRRPPSWR